MFPFILQLLLDKLVPIMGDGIGKFARGMDKLRYIVIGIIIIFPNIAIYYGKGSSLSM